MYASAHSGGALWLPIPDCRILSQSVVISVVVLMYFFAQLGLPISNFALWLPVSESDVLSSDVHVQSSNVRPPTFHSRVPTSKFRVPSSDFQRWIPSSEPVNSESELESCKIPNYDKTKHWYRWKVTGVQITTNKHTLSKILPVPMTYIMIIISQMFLTPVLPPCWNARLWWNLRCHTLHCQNQT